MLYTSVSFFFYHVHVFLYFFNEKQRGGKPLNTAMLSSLSLSQELHFKSGTKSMDVESKYTHIKKMLQVFTVLFIKNVLQDIKHQNEKNNPQPI